MGDHVRTPPSEMMKLRETMRQELVEIREEVGTMGDRLSTLDARHGALRQIIMRILSHQAGRDILQRDETLRDMLIAEGIGIYTAPVDPISRHLNGTFAQRITKEFDHGRTAAV